MFTKQHYKAIADIIKKCGVRRSQWDTISPHDLTGHLADYFQRDNPLFSRQKWFDYLNDQIK